MRNNLGAAKRYEKNGADLSYFEIPNARPKLVLIHAQGVDARNFDGVAGLLKRDFHVYSVDCYGHGGSSHDASQYNIAAIGDAMIHWIADEIGGPVAIAGHSSGGLIAAYIAARSELCARLILEDPPFFASQGERRRRTFNYIDLSTICHEFLNQTAETDFPLYYFENQRAWRFFPEKSREKIRAKLTGAAKKNRQKHPGGDLKVPFWPKAALAGFQGMNQYDPRFGEAFYDDSFHAGIPHEALLKDVRAQTLFMKARTQTGDDGLLMAALSEEDARRVVATIPNCAAMRFDTGHGIHIEKPRAFAAAIREFCAGMEN